MISFSLENAIFWNWNLSLFVCVLHRQTALCSSSGDYVMMNVCFDQTCFCQTFLCKRKTATSSQTNLVYGGVRWVGASLAFPVCEEEICLDVSLLELSSCAFFSA